MADLVRHAIGVDLVEIALRQALGEEVPDELVAAALLAAARDPLPHRRSPGRCRPAQVTRIGSLDAVLAPPGVVQADIYLAGGRDDPAGAARRRPARLRDRDRRHERGGARARRGGGAAARRGACEARVSCAFDLDALPRAARGGAGGRLPLRVLRPRAAAGDLLLRHDVDLSLDAALRMAELEAEAGAAATYFLMTRVVFYNLDSHEGDARDRAAARARPPRRPPRRLAARRPRRALRPGRRLAQPRPRVHARAGRRRAST